MSWVLSVDPLSITNSSVDIPDGALALQIDSMVGARLSALFRVQMIMEMDGIV
jgi:hypothetical protein